ncbi:MAG TPA: hypothetical protein VJN43_07885 [Bryobacteraceae bacterium]|nr:hypothetical protein [Bryobacteraceae bacterium]
MMKITGQGLCSIAVVTGILWGCIVIEKRTVDHARAEGYRAIQEIRALQLKRRALPATSPVPVDRRPSRAFAG